MFPVSHGWINAFNWLMINILSYCFIYFVCFLNSFRWEGKSSFCCPSLDRSRTRFLHPHLIFSYNKPSCSLRKITIYTATHIRNFLLSLICPILSLVQSNLSRSTKSFPKYTTNILTFCPYTYTTLAQVTLGMWTWIT